MSTSTALAFRLSRGLLATAPPPIPQAYKWASEFRDAASLLDMSQGAPKDPPARLLREALTAASASASSYGYCPAEGELPLRRAVADEMKHIYKLNTTDVTEDDIALTAGCNMAFMATVMALADASDEVILPVPWYFNHEMTLTTLGIKPIALKTSPENGFMPTVEDCRALITEKTKAIALVSPNNPTGAVYPHALLEDMFKLAQEHKVALILDETYRDFITGERPHSLFSKPWRTNLIHLYSFSKSYRIPGLRLGAIAGDPELLNALITVLDSMQICPPRIPQIALGSAGMLQALRSDVTETAQAIQSRHILFKDALPPRWSIASQGGYYAFVRHPFKGVNSRDVSRRLAQELGVITLPSAFFCEVQTGEAKNIHYEEESGQYIRFSVANVDDLKIREICDRLQQAEGLWSEWKVDA